MTDAATATFFAMYSWLAVLKISEQPILERGVARSLQKVGDLHHEGSEVVRCACVCLYVCMTVCVCVRVRVRMCVRMRACARACVCVRVWRQW